MQTHQPLHLFMAKIKHPESIGKRSARRAPKMIHPRQVKRQFIEKQRRETETLPLPPVKQKKGRPG